MNPSSSFDPRTAFPQFYENQAIKILGGVSRWTISGQIGDPDPVTGEPATNKAPINARALIDEGRVSGAWSPSSQCLVTLDELAEHVPLAANCAFRARSAADGYLILDIEKTCPPEVSAELLALPGIHYSEVSMSGRGFHLVVDPPSNFTRWPDALTRPTLQEEHGWYEFLLEHYVTFTRRPLTQHDVDRAAAVDPATARFTSVEDVWTHLASTARPNITSAAAIPVAVEPPEIAMRDILVAAAVSSASALLKDPQTFNDDLSRWEFSTLSILYRMLRHHIRTHTGLGLAVPSDSDTTWLLFLAAREVLPHRPKHSELRNGRPYLLDRAAAMVASKQAGQA